VAKILIVDDERTTRLALSEAFRQKGYQATQVGSGDRAIAELVDTFYDVVILDLEMPGIKGTDVLVQTENLAPDTAFIVLTAHASTETAILALRSGAFDYLRKPSSLDKIFTAVDRAIAKQEAQKRQKEAVGLLQQAFNALSSPKLTNTMSAEYAAAGTADILLDERQQTALYKQTQLELTPIEYKLLKIFVHEPDTIITYAELAQQIHGMDVDESEARSLLRTHVYRLSRKLGDKEDTPLQNVRGRGVILYTQMPTP
jgi:DNA-binding response OmpR family regulator